MRTTGFVLSMFVASSVVSAADKIVTFDDQTSLVGAEVRGDVRIVSGKGRDGAGGALQLAPGASVAFKLADADGAGRVTLWVYDDGSTPADPKKRHVGPRWGLRQSDGRVLGVGILYAPYLAGDRTYCTTESSDRKNWFNVQYLGECRRVKGWHQWTFNMDPEKGLTILMDGKDVNARRKRFDWNKTKLAGFNAVVVYGDSKDGKQTILVDDLKASTAGPMAVQPTPPPPQPPVVPAADPVEPNPPAFKKELIGVHPRILLGKQDVPRIQRLAASEEGKIFMNQLNQYMKSCHSGPGTRFLKDATDGQRQGLWRMPTIAMHYLITGDSRTLAAGKKFLEALLRMPHWETTRELDSGMSSANVLFGAAFLYDVLYNDLDPDFRERFRQKLILMARRQYYGGHLRRNPGPHYWQADPANNHRWHRDAGMVCAILAAYEGHKKDDWILARSKEELDFVTKWLPEDGTTHEGPGYQVFGSAHLTLALQAADRCLGTQYLKLDYFRNAPAFRMHTLAPGLKEVLSFGDGGGLGTYNNFLYKALSVHKQPDLQDGIREFHKRNPDAFWLGWMSLLWFDPSVNGGDYTRLRTSALFPDIGVAVMRDSWAESGVAALFKCGPFGGYKLNAYRNSARPAKYINVAHDDPDANSFVLFAHGQLLAETDRYSKHKQSSNHNTILVGGLGQMVPGRPEGGAWSQPATGNYDMTDMAVITAYKAGNKVTMVEGEAAGSYLKTALRLRQGPNRGKTLKRPALERFRRTFIWVKGKYVLVLDDIRSTEKTTIDWLMQSGTMTARDQRAGAYLMAKNGVSMGMQVVSDKPTTASIVPSTADHRGRPLGWQQLRLSAEVDAIRFASVYDPWGNQVKVALTAETADAATVRVTGNAIDDTWTWKSATGKFTPSTIIGKLSDGERVTLTPADATPKP